MGQGGDLLNDFLGFVCASGGGVDDYDLEGGVLGSDCGWGHGPGERRGGKKHTSAPRLPNSKAIPAPIPREPPVTRAVLPLRVRGEDMAGIWLGLMVRGKGVSGSSE